MDALEKMFDDAGVEMPEWMKNEPEHEPKPMKKYIVRIWNGYYDGEPLLTTQHDTFDTLHDCIEFINRYAKRESNYDVEYYPTNTTVLYHKYDFDEDIIYEKIGDILNKYHV